MGHRGHAGQPFAGPAEGRVPGIHHPFASPVFPSPCPRAAGSSLVVHGAIVLAPVARALPSCLWLRTTDHWHGDIPLTSSLSAVPPDPIAWRRAYSRLCLGDYFA